MTVRRDRKREKLLQYADRVWGLVDGTEESRIDQAIAKTRDFFEAVGVRTKLSDYGVGLDVIPLISDRFEKRGFVALGEHQDVTPKVVAQILTLCA
jgi:NADP-dependent alcohol dehydrogenase